MLKRRKWGWYLTLWSEKRFKIKFLFFKRDHCCSVQRHAERNELWLVLLGKGYKHGSEFVGRGDWFNVTSDTWHSYFAEKPTIILEIQYGTNCREDDIERV